MNRLVTTRTPAGSPAHEPGVVNPANDKGARSGLLLEMAFNTKRLVPLRQQLVINRAVDRVAAGASLAHGFVLEDERPALGDMASATSFTDTGEGCAQAFSRWSFVGIVAVRAADPALEHRVVKWEIEFAALVQVAIEADLG
jgi:hypothetical protein